jgi:arylsulfatase A-like enzyme
LIAAEGWAAPESFGADGPASWVVGRRARILFPPVPGDGPADLIAECHSLRVSDASRGERLGARRSTQQMRVQLGGELSEAVALSSDWQTVRVALPHPTPRPALVEAWLLFDRATAPAAAGLGDDRRRLAAACRRLAVIPRHVADADRVSAGAKMDADGLRLTLAPDTAIGLPLRPGSEMRLTLGRIDPQCRGCRVRVEVVAGNAVETLWEGDPAGADGLELSFTAPAKRYSRLRLHLLPGAGGEGTAHPGVTIALGDAFLAYRARRDGARGLGRTHAFLYLVDTLRADSLEPYGAQRPSSPYIRRFARSAVVYSNAWATSTWTLPSLASVLTGALPSRHGAMTGGRKLRPAETPTLAAEMTQRGYRTLGISQSYVGGPAFGLDRGFDTFVLSDRLNSRHLSSQEIRSIFVRWLLAQPSADDPLFVSIHTVDPHAPYSPRPPYDRFTARAPATLPPDRYQPLVFQRERLGGDPAAVAHLRALYDGEVLHADEQFGRFVELLDYLGLADRSLIALYSDHGEEFGEHGGFDHGRTLYEELLRVPLVVRFPAAAGAGGVRKRRVSLLDLPATVLALSGGLPRFRLDGRPLRTREPPSLGRRRALLAELRVPASRTRAAVDLLALSLGDHKCTRNRAGVDQFNARAAPWQFFDLARDPGEQHPLEPTLAASRKCRQRLEDALRRIGTPGAQDDDPDPDVDNLEALRALGYLE